MFLASAVWRNSLIYLKVLFAFSTDLGFGLCKTKNLNKNNAYESIFDYYHLCCDTWLNACKFLVALGIPQLIQGHIKYLRRKNILARGWFPIQFTLTLILFRYCSNFSDYDHVTTKIRANITTKEGTFLCLLILRDGLKIARGGPKILLDWNWKVLFLENLHGCIF